MRRILVFSLFVVLLAPASAFAAAPYTLTRFSGAFTPITTGGGATTIAFANLDNGAVTLALPFAFTYFGGAFATTDFLNVCTNGYAYLRHPGDPMTSAPTNTLLFSSVSTLRPLAPWIDDLSLAAVGANPAGSVLYQTQGSVGSRTFTVQWTGVSSYKDAVSGQPRRIGFQLILYETTNVVEFHYGSKTGASYSTSESASIGIGDGFGAPRPYIDGITGSSKSNTAKMTTNFWPARHLRFTPGSPSPLASGSYPVGTAMPYPNLGEAIADVNHRGISGPVTLSLTDALYDSTANVFPFVLGPIEGSSATNTLTIAPASGTSTLRHRGVGTGHIGIANDLFWVGRDPLFAVVGADHVTIRNLALDSGGSGPANIGIWVINSSPTDGAQDNTFRDLSVSLSRAHAYNTGIHQFAGSGSIAEPTSAAGANSSNRYQNLTISRCDIAIELDGSSDFPDQSCEIASTGGGATILGGATPPSFLSLSGIEAYSQKDLSILGCEIRNVAGTGIGGLASGIILDNTALAAGVSGGTCVISGNEVHDLTGPITTAAGIVVGIDPEAASEMRVTNNMIYLLEAASPETATRPILGISVQPDGSASAGSVRVAHNSVRLQPSAIGCSNAALEIGSASIDLVEVHDNIFANFTAAQTGAARHFTWVTAGTGAVGGAGSASDYNLLYVANLGNGYVGSSGGGDHATLGDWQAAISDDANSLSADPYFVTPTNLHILVPSSPASDAGTPLAFVPSDLDGETRSATPDMGADEFTPITAVGESGATELALAPVSPNPSSWVQSIRFSLPHSAPVRLAIFDLSGRLVATIADGVHAAGWHTYQWGGADGPAPAPGLYFVSLQTPEARITRRLVRS